MICRTLAVDSLKDWQTKATWLQDRSQVSTEVETQVEQILQDVRTKGDNALLDYTRKFDAPDFAPPLRCTPEQLEKGASRVTTEEREHIFSACDNILAFHHAQKVQSWFTTRNDGTILGQRVLPVDAAGLYIPGGQGGNTPLVSTLLMTAIPAQAAGVSRIVLCTPPRKDGTINPYILATARILGIEEIYRVGGAWSIGALAYGTESIAPVDVIAGPGNIYVTTAKRLVQGRVGIDMIAGPSEVLILCDGLANISYVAADMLSQAEHDTLASAICITTDARLLDELPKELAYQCQRLPRAEIARKSLQDWGAIVHVPSLRVALEISNAIAPEHLELYIRDPWSVLTSVRHAGAIFLGGHSPEPLGDYFAGPNHVLPTMGTARFASGLSVETFVKKSNIIAASPYFLQKSLEDVPALARLEGLEAHARALEIRRKI